MIKDESHAAAFTELAKSCPDCAIKKLDRPAVRELVVASRREWHRRLAAHLSRVPDHDEHDHREEWVCWRSDEEGELFDRRECDFLRQFNSERAAEHFVEDFAGTEDDPVERDRQTWLAAIQVSDTTYVLYRVQVRFHFEAERATP